MTPENEISRGYEAKLILDNPIYKESWESIRDSIISAMGQSAMGDEKTHTKLVMALQIINKLQKTMESHMETGKLAQLQLDNKKTWWKS